MFQNIRFVFVEVRSMWTEPQSIYRVTQQIYGDFKALTNLKIYSTGPI